MSALLVAIYISTFLCVADTQSLPVYDGYEHAKASVNPAAAQPLYDQHYFANIPNFGPCVLTAQLQLFSGDNVRLNQSSGQRVSQVTLGVPDYVSPSDIHSPKSLLLFNSTLLRGCSDRALLSPMYSGVPDQSPHDFVHEKNLFYAASTEDERSGSIDVAFNSVRARGTLVPIRTITDLLFGGVIGECVSNLPEWQLPSASAIQNGNRQGTSSAQQLSALGALISNRFSAIDLQGIRDFIVDDQLTAKSKSSNSIKEAPSTGPLISKTPLTLTVIGEDGAEALRYSSTSTTLNDLSPEFITFANSQLVPISSTSSPVRSNITTNAELMLLLDTLSTNSLNTLLSSCIRKQVRNNPTLFSTAFNGLPISIIGGILLSDDAILGLKSFAAAAAQSVRKDPTIFFPSTDSENQKSFSNFSKILYEAIAPFYRSYLLPMEANRAAARFLDHVQFEHYFTLGPAVVAMSCANSEELAYNKQPSSSAESSATDLLKMLFESDGYNYAFYNNTSKQSSFYALGSYLSSTENVAQQWQAIVQRSVFNAQQVLGGGSQWSVKTRYQIATLLFALSASFSVSTAPVLASVAMALKPAFEYQSKAVMRLSTEAPVVFLSHGQFSESVHASESAIGKPEESNHQSLAQTNRHLSSAAITKLLSSFTFEEGDTPPIDRRGPLLQSRSSQSSTSPAASTRNFIALGASESLGANQNDVSNRNAGETWSNFYSTPLCLETSPPTCSPVGGLNVWATTTIAPKGYYDPVNATTLSEGTSSFATTASKRFTPNGSIAVMVSSASTSSLFHDIIPSASAAAADTTALLLVIDTLSKSLLAAVNYNGTLLREVLGLPAGGSAQADDANDELVLAALGQLYFFFFVGEDGAGFSGSGRLIKESLSFQCSDASGGDNPRQDGVDCNFPFYWFTNFSRTISLENFTHFIAMDGVLDLDGQVEENVRALEAKILHDAEGLTPLQNGLPTVLNISERYNYTFYAYTDAGLNTQSPAQRLVNDIIATKVNGSVRQAMNPQAPVELYINNNVFVSLSSGGGSLTIDTSSSIGAASNSNSFTMLNVSYKNYSSMPSGLGGDEWPSGGSSIVLSSTIPPCSLWSFMLSAFGDITAEEAALYRAQEDTGMLGVAFTPSQWKARSFTLLSSVPPDAKLVDTVAQLGRPGASDVHGNSSDNIFAKSYFTSSTNANSLRTARRVSSSLDTFASAALGERIEGKQRVPTSSSLNLPPQHRFILRQRAIHQMLAAVSDTISNVILGLVNAQLQDVISNANMTGPSATSAALARAESAVASISPLRSSVAEAHRLFYCLAGNTNCLYMQGANFVLGASIPAEVVGSGDSTAYVSQSSPSINSPNYYNGVFSYYYTISAQVAIAQMYSQDRLKSSYNQRVGVRSATGGEDLFGRPCDPSYADGSALACNVRYQRCMQNYNATALSSNAPPSFGCYPLASFYSHAFGPAATYDPAMPSSASYVADWPYINGDWLSMQSNTVENSSSVPQNSFAASVPEYLASPSVFISAQQVSALFFSLRTEVESYWYSGGAKDIGARVGLAASPALLWTTFGAGLGALVLVAGAVVAFYCAVEPLVYSRKEGERRERLRWEKQSRGPTETRAFVPAIGEIRYATAVDAMDEGDGSASEDLGGYDSALPQQMAPSVPAREVEETSEPLEQEAKGKPVKEKRKTKLHRTPHQVE